MKVIVTDRAQADFYTLLGPVFGSRGIEKATHDRFYDDQGKVWYVICGKGAASVSSGVIKNFWADSDEAADAMLEEIRRHNDALSGIVPLAYEGAFRRAGFVVAKHSKNFMEVIQNEGN